MDKKLKIAPQGENTEAQPLPPQKPAAFIVPAKVMDEIYAYIGKGPWLEVNNLINWIASNSQPIKPSQTKTNEEENLTALAD